MIGFFLLDILQFHYIFNFMIKHIIAAADIHLRPIARHSEYKKVFNKFIREVKDNKPDRLILAGDLLHSKITVSNEAFSILSKFLNALAKHTKVIIIPGNHDAVIGSERMDSISPIIEMINNPDIVYYKNSGCYVDNWDESVVYAVWSCLDKQESPEIDGFKADYDLNSDKTYIGLYHGVINGSKTPLGFTFIHEGMDSSEFFHTDFFIAGDIHLYQTYEYDNYTGKGFGIMTGSLIQQNFGEKSEHHGYINLIKKNNIWSHELIEIDNEHNYYTFELKDFEDLENL
jgi:DNA repair exonuclease SbcCD nuclease subunit